MLLLAKEKREQATQNIWDMLELPKYRSILKGKRKKKGTNRDERSGIKALLYSPKQIRSSGFFSAY